MNQIEAESLSLTLLAVNIAMRDGNSVLNSLLPNSITVNEIGELTNCLHVQIQVDKQALSSHAERIVRRRRTDLEYSWSIEKGATNYMLGYFFPEVHSSEKASSVRSALKSKLLKSNCQINEQDAKRIYEIWMNSPLLSEYDRMKHIFGEFKNKYDLGIIYKNIKEFEGFKS